MPLTITAETPRKERTISGLKLTVPQPFAEGQPMTASLANILNQTLAENVSNNLRSKIAEFVPAGSPEGTKARPATAEEAQGLIDTYLQTYEPGAGRVGGGGGATRLSPVEKEMRVIARGKLNELLTSQNIKRTSLPKEGERSYEGLVTQIIDQNADALRARAEQIVAERTKASAGDGLNLGNILGGGDAAKGSGKAK